MKKILLLNPPGRQLYIREYFCSKVSQADYITPPIDLVMLSGIVSKEYDVVLVDAVAGRMTPEKALKEISKDPPFAVITLFGAASFAEDNAFILKLRQAIPEALIIGIGDLFRDDTVRYLQNGAPLDAILLDFTSDDILLFLRGDRSSVRNMVYREHNDVRTAPLKRAQGMLSRTIPRHELFLKYNYRYPFIRKNTFVSILTEYGCPYKCSFCVMATLGYAARTVANIIDELKYIASLGVGEVLMCTQTFGSNQAYATELCNKIVEERIGLGWVCFSRVDVVTPALLTAMKAAGCHSIIFGIESGSEKILQRYQKGYTVKQITATIDYCASIGIETVGTFIIGLPEEDRSTLQETLQLLGNISLDYASFNVAVPRAGTPLRQEALESGLVGRDFSVMDQSGSEIAMPTNYLSKEDIRKFRRKAIRVFYLRRRYIVARMKKIVSLADFIRQLRQGIYLLINTWLRNE